MKYLPLLLIIAIEGSWGISCNNYLCQDLNTNYTVGDNFTCGNFDYFNYRFQQCPNLSEVCDVPNWETSGLLNCTNITQKGAGEPCLEASECYTEACTQEGRCWGKPIASHCNDNKECVRGSYCTTEGRCYPVSLIGHNCNSTKPCPTFGTCVNSKCVSKYSLPIGTEVIGANMTGYGLCMFSLNTLDVCESGWANPSTNGNHVCSKGSKLTGYSGDPIMVYSGSQLCNYTNYTSAGEEKFQECGVCSYGEFFSDDESYCPPGTLDFASELADLKAYFALGIHCNLGEGMFCQAAKLDNIGAYMTAYKAYITMTDYAHTLDIPDCMYDVLPLKGYIQAKDYISKRWWILWGSIIGGGVLLVAGVLVLLYFLLWK